MVQLTVVVMDMSGKKLSNIHVVWHDKNWGIDVENNTNSSGFTSCNWTLGDYTVFVNSPDYYPYNSYYDSFIDALYHDPYAGDCDQNVFLSKAPNPTYNIIITKIEVT